MMLWLNGRQVAEAADTGLVVIDGKFLEKPVLRDMYCIVATADGKVDEESMLKVEIKAS